MGVKEMREWQRGKTDCASCTQECCSTDRYQIEIRPDEAGPFTERGVPIVRPAQLDLTWLKFWNVTNKGYLRDREGRQLEGPMLVGGDRGVLYVYAKNPALCPLYSVKDRKWEKIKPNGPAGPTERRPIGYFDPERNVMVTNDRAKVWVYRHKKATK